MCHSEPTTFFGAVDVPESYSEIVSARHYGDSTAARKIAVLPDIYGLTPFYQSFASFIGKQGPSVFLVNPWEPWGELPEPTREAAYERRHKLRDRAYCNELEKFIDAESIDTIVGFCIGANFLFELVRRGYRGKCLAIYPLPWGMENADAIAPAFDYMPDIDHPVTIVMGEQDPLAGPDNIEKMRAICFANPALDLHLYEGSGHGFLNDVEGEDEKLRDNAFNALQVSLAAVFPEKGNEAVASMLSDRMRQVGGG